MSIGCPGVLTRSSRCSRRLRLLLENLDEPPRKGRRLLSCPWWLCSGCSARSSQYAIVYYSTCKETRSDTLQQNECPLSWVWVLVSPSSRVHSTTSEAAMTASRGRTTSLSARRLSDEVPDWPLSKPFQRLARAEVSRARHLTREYSNSHTSRHPTSRLRGATGGAT